jgi:hypothetical protein
VRVTLDGAAIARAVVDAFDPMGAAARAATAALVGLARELRAFRGSEARRRRRARYEIREAILARRLGIAPEPWRGQ